MDLFVIQNTNIYPSKNGIIDIIMDQHNTTSFFDRNEAITRIQNTDEWDIVVIGGGASGLGIALDAVTRGFKTLLLEQVDFAKGTSSRSTKLVHGGVRYLAQGDVKLVYDALRERALIFKNAPHVAHVQSFTIPCYSLLSKLKFLIGLTIYDWMAGKHRIGKSSFISERKIARYLSGIHTDKLKGGIEYFDGQFDDSRLAINIAQTAHIHGATLINHAKVNNLTKNKSGKTNGLSFIDEENGSTYQIKAKVVVNATGVFVDDILSLDAPKHVSLIRPSQGIHLVVDRSFLGGKSALMIPETSDGRVLFGVPWHGHLVLGTTDTPLKEHSLEPQALEQEINFILDTAATYLVKKPQRKDVLSVFAGLRPLAAPTKNKETTKEISRDHKLLVSKSALITITGGKWTTYRKMAEETVNKAIKVAGLKNQTCKTYDLKIHGHTQQVKDDHLRIYGSDADGIRKLENNDPDLKKLLHPDHPYTVAQVIWAARNEMARTVEDVLARRIRILFLNAHAAIEMAPKVAAILKKDLEKDDQWEKNQVANFVKLAKGYLLIEKL